jgi:hypothetical protein
LRGVGRDVAQIVARVGGEPIRQPRLLSSEAELGADAGEGVVLEDAAQLALFQSGADSGAPWLEACDRFDPGANDVFDAGKTPRGNLCLGGPCGVFRKVGGLDVSAIELASLSQKRRDTDNC